MPVSQHRHGLFGFFRGFSFGRRHGGPACGNRHCNGSCAICCQTLQLQAQEVCDLIYRSQNDCYASGRRSALKRLSNRYDCDEFPDVMCALVYGLNDGDERVRRMAADEIGDQLRENPCCCQSWVVDALTASLCDCDWRVRREAKQALRVCGYTIMEGPCTEMLCCDACCDVFCDSGCNDWLPPAHQQFEDDDFMDGDDGASDYDPPAVEGNPFVPPSPAPEGRTNPPAAYFPPASASTAVPMGLKVSSRESNWLH